MRHAQVPVLISLAACHPASLAPDAAEGARVRAAPVETARADVETSTSPEVPERLRSCLPEVRWTQGALGAWGVSERLPGPEGLEMWRASQRCTSGSRWTSVVLDDALDLADRVGDVFPRRCKPPRLRSSEKAPPDEALNVDADVRGVLNQLGDAASGRADEAQDYAARGRRQRDPLSAGMRGQGARGPIVFVRLLVLPMPAEELLGCWATSATGEREPARDAVLGRWHGRWRAVPYAMTAGTYWLHVPMPPQRLGAIASVAVEIAHVSPTLRLDGTEEYFVRAASQFWPMDRE